MAFDNEQQLQHTAADCGRNESCECNILVFHARMRSDQAGKATKCKNNVEEMDSDGIRMRARLHSNFWMTASDPISSRKFRQLMCARAHTHIHTHKMRSRAWRREEEEFQVGFKTLKSGDWKAKMTQRACLSRFCHLRLWTQILQNQNLVNGVVRIGCVNRRLSWENSGSISSQIKLKTQTPPKTFNPTEPTQFRNCKPKSHTHTTPHSQIPNSKFLSLNPL